MDFYTRSSGHQPAVDVTEAVIQREFTAPVVSQPQAATVPLAAPAESQFYSKSVDGILASPEKRFQRLRSTVQIIALSIGGVAIGIASTDQRVGQALVVVLGITGVVFKFRSQYIFALAIFTLSLIPILLLIQKEGLANNYAVYSFLLLIFGVISAMFELHREQGFVARTA